MIAHVHFHLSTMYHSSTVTRLSKADSPFSASFSSSSSPPVLESSPRGQITWYEGTSSTLRWSLKLECHCGFAVECGESVRSSLAHGHQMARFDQAEGRRGPQSCGPLCWVGQRLREPPWARHVGSHSHSPGCQHCVYSIICSWSDPVPGKWKRVTKVES